MPSNQTAARIAIASGKGGTGKTTIATSLALALAGQLEAYLPPLYLDCDAEAPNAHLFLQPQFTHSRAVNLLIPEVDESRCTHCGTCAEICQYHAIAVLGQKTLVFPQLCHGCGSCTALCPEDAISEYPKPIGELGRGRAKSGIDFGRGLLQVGEPMAVPVIRQLKSWVQPKAGQVTILDAPPGTSCPVVETIRGADFLLLVTEPTPFGLHDLQLAAQIADEIGIPAGVVINRHGTAFEGIETFCRKKDLPVLMRIPFEREIAAGIAAGKALVELRPNMAPKFIQLYEEISLRISRHVQVT